MSNRRRSIFEDFESMGLVMSEERLKNMYQKRLDESTAFTSVTSPAAPLETPAPEAADVEDDYILTMEHIEAILDLELDDISRNDLIDLVEDFEKYDVDENDAELVEAARKTVNALRDYLSEKMMYVRGLKGRSRRRVCPPGKMAKGEKCVPVDKAARRKRNRKARLAAKKGPAKQRRRRYEKKRRARGLDAGVEGLIGDLRTEQFSNGNADLAEAVDRVDRILFLISEHFDHNEELISLFESRWTPLAEGLFESDEDAVDALRPVLSMIQKAMERIESGN